MKRTILFFAILIIALTAMAQATQPCVVKQYNGKKAKTPLSGVRVHVDGAQTATSAADGRFALIFNTLKPGDQVLNVSAMKPGFEIFNKASVEQWNISRGNVTFTLVLVKSDEFAQLVGKLTQTSKNTYQAKYEEKVRELEQLKKDGELREEEFNKKYDELDEKYREQLKNLDNYIDQFARIDLSEVSAEEQRILDMVQEGKIQEAVLVYDSLELGKKLTSETSDYLELSRVIKTTEELRNQKRANIDALYESIYRQVSTMVLADKYEEATNVLLSAMNDFSKLFDEDPETNRPQFADLQFRVGEMLADHQIGGEKKAVGYFTSALSNYLILCDSMPERYSAYVANTRIRIGKCKAYELDYSGAESMYLEALAIWKQQTEQDEMKCLKEVASTQNLLGQLYSQWTSRQDQAEEFYQSALDNYALLVRGDSMAYLPDMASIKSGMAGFFYEKKDYEKAEHFFIEALKDYAFLAENNTEYLEALEIRQRVLGDFYGSLWRSFKYIAEKDPERLEALESRQNEPDHYFAKLWHDFKTGELFAKAEKYYKEACQTALQKDGKPGINSRLNWLSLSNLYLENDEDQKAEACIKEYNEIEARFEGTPLDEDSSAKSLYEMANSYFSKGNPEKALQYYQDAMRKGLYKEAPLNTATLYLDIAFCYLVMGDSTKMAESTATAFNLLDSWAKNNQEESNFTVLTLAMSTFKFKLLVSTYSNLHERFQNIDTNSFKQLLQENYTQLLLRHYAIHEKEIAEAQRDLGDIYVETEQYNRAEQSYQAALECLKKLRQEQKNEFGQYADMAKLQSDLGELYLSHIEDTLRAEECYIQAINLYTLAENNRTNTNESFEDIVSFDKNKYKADISYNQQILGILYYFKDENEKADSLLKQAYDNYRLYIDTHPNKEVEREDFAIIAQISYFEAMTLRYLSKMEEYDRWLSFATDCYERLHEAYPQSNIYKIRLLYLTYYQALRDADLNKPDESVDLLLRCQESGEISDIRLVSGYNAAAYAYARAKKYEKALETIDRAIALMPEEANLYDSKGEILLMKGDEQEAVKMWHKIQELDPDFLQKYEGESEFIRQLKEKGLIE